MSLLLTVPLRQCNYTHPGFIPCVGRSLGEAYNATRHLRHSELIENPAGGFGNQVEGVLSVWMLALVTDRRAVVINPLIRALYEPPLGFAEGLTSGWTNPTRRGLQQLKHMRIRWNASAYERALMGHAAVAMPRHFAGMMLDQLLVMGATTVGAPMIEALRRIGVPFGWALSQDFLGYVAGHFVLRQLSRGAARELRRYSAAAGEGCVAKHASRGEATTAAGRTDPRNEASAISAAVHFRTFADAVTSQGQPDGPDNPVSCRNTSSADYGFCSLWGHKPHDSFSQCALGAIAPTPQPPGSSTATSKPPAGRCAFIVSDNPRWAVHLAQQLRATGYPAVTEHALSRRSGRWVAGSARDALTSGWQQGSWHTGAPDMTAEGSEELSRWQRGPPPEGSTREEAVWRHPSLLSWLLLSRAPTKVVTGMSIFSNSALHAGAARSPRSRTTAWHYRGVESSLKCLSVDQAFIHPDTASG